MKIQEADEKLSQMANGEHRAVSYELSTYKSGRQETKCGIYIGGGPWFIGNTFEECFNKRFKKEENQNI